VLAVAPPDAGAGDSEQVSYLRPGAALGSGLGHQVGGAFAGLGVKAGQKVQGGGGVGGALVAITACAAICVIRVLMIGGIGARDAMAAIGPLCFMLLASTAAATSSVRGLRAFRTRPGT
jgi:hypothetical protein